MKKILLIISNTLSIIFLILATTAIASGVDNAISGAVFAFDMALIFFIPQAIIIGKRIKQKRQSNKKQIDCINNYESQIEDLKNQLKALTEEKNALEKNKQQVLEEYKQYVLKIIEDCKQQALENIGNNMSQEIKKHSKLQAECNKYQNNVFKLQEMYKSFEYAIKIYESENFSHLDEALLHSFDASLVPLIEIQPNCLNIKQLRTRYKLIKDNINKAYERYEKYYTDKTDEAMYRLMVISLESELQTVLSNLKYNKYEESLECVKKITARYLSIIVDGNPSTVPTTKKFIAEIEYLFIEILKTEYEYYTQRERIKEEQRAIKEQMRQEAEERRALELQQQQIEKEESKYISEISTINTQIKESTDNEQIQKLKERIEQLQEQLKAVHSTKEEIIKLQNGKAGYVYIISNLGSFGDNVFKVGMTRRLDPMERVKELGDASVPFSFDVHSFIFSDDAVGLENALHKELDGRRVNKINHRKEFFNITIDEIEDIVYKHSPTAEFNRTMLAEEYNQGLLFVQ